MADLDYSDFDFDLVDFMETDFFWTFDFNFDFDFDFDIDFDFILSLDPPDLLLDYYLLIVLTELLLCCVGLCLSLSFDPLDPLGL